jgi:hypothetical protein
VTQQVPPQPSKLRKGFLIVGVVLLITGFFFFYGASKINFEYTTSYQDTVNLSHSVAMYNYDFGNGNQTYYEEYPAKPYNLHLQRGDHLSASYDVLTRTNGTVYLVLWQSVYNEKVLTHSGYPYSINELHFWAGTDIWVEVYVVSVNRTNIVPVTITVYHYEPPQWVLFGGGVVLSSLALVSIFKSKK